MYHGGTKNNGVGDEVCKLEVTKKKAATESDR